MKHPFRLLLLAALVSGLAPAQRMIIFQRAPAPPGVTIPAATARWEGSATDVVGSNNCTPVNSPTSVTEGLDFEADDDEYMHCGNIAGGYDADTVAISVCAVVNIESFVDAAIVSQEWTGFPKGWSMRTTTGSDILFRIFEISAGMRIETTSALSTATVYHICATAPTNPTATTAAIYVNGSAVAETVVENDLGAADADVTVPFYWASAHTATTDTADMTFTVGTYWHGAELTPAQVAAQCEVDKAFAATQGVTVSCP